MPKINGHPADLADIAGLFLIALDPGTDLLSNTITNDMGIEVGLAVGGTDLNPGDWDDLYLLLEYEVSAS